NHRPLSSIAPLLYRHSALSISSLFLHLHVPPATLSPPLSPSPPSPPISILLHSTPHLPLFSLFLPLHLYPAPPTSLLLASLLLHSLSSLQLSRTISTLCALSLSLQPFSSLSPPSLPPWLSTHCLPSPSLRSLIP
ncbi:unnamed protein product, partial [Lampetra planeri]